MKEQPPNTPIRRGQTVFLVVSRVRIREAVVCRVQGGLYTIRFTDTGGGIRVAKDRLYPTREAAQGELRQAQPLSPARIEGGPHWHNVPLWMA